MWSSLVYWLRIWKFRCELSRVVLGYALLRWWELVCTSRSSLAKIRLAWLKPWINQLILRPIRCQLWQTWLVGNFSVAVVSSVLYVSLLLGSVVSRVMIAPCWAVQSPGRVTNETILVCLSLISREDWYCQIIRGFSEESFLIQNAFFVMHGARLSSNSVHLWAKLDDEKLGLLGWWGKLPVWGRKRFAVAVKQCLKWNIASLYDRAFWWKVKPITTLRRAIVPK